MSNLTIASIVISLTYLGLFIFAREGSILVEMAELDLNALGDFLAGAFAPLAFGWLVVAVFIQASELKAQREELAATRQEVELATVEQREQRKVMAIQAEQAGMQSEFIGKQTELLEQEHKLRESVEVSKLVDIHVREITNAIYEAGGNFGFEVEIQLSDTKIVKYDEYFGWTPDDSSELDPYEVVRIFSGYLHKDLVKFKKSLVSATPTSPDQLHRVLDAIELIENLERKIPEIAQYKLETMGVTRFCVSFRNLLAKLLIDPNKM